MYYVYSVLDSENIQCWLNKVDIILTHKKLDSSEMKLPTNSQMSK